jgi:type III secretory pathway component EscT
MSAFIGLVDIFDILLPAELLRSSIFILLLPLSVPHWVRIACAATIPYLIMSGIVSLYDLTARMVIQELLVGAVLVTPLALGVQVIRYVGEMFDGFRGHSLGQMVAPFAEGNQGLLATFLEQGCISYLASVGVLTLLVVILHTSYASIPLQVPLESSVDVVKHLCWMVLTILSYTFSLVAPLGLIFVGVDILFGVGSTLLNRFPLQNEASQIKNLITAFLIVAFFQEGSLLSTVSHYVVQLSEDWKILSSLFLSFHYTM